MATPAEREQLQLEKYGTHLSGFVAAAHTPGYGQEASFPLPLNLQELKLQLSIEFGLQVASVQIRTWCPVSAGAPVPIWAELSSQDDLVAAVEELNDMGMHRLTIEATGRSSVRALTPPFSPRHGALLFAHTRSRPVRVGAASALVW